MRLIRRNHNPALVDSLYLWNQKAGREKPHTFSHDWNRISYAALPNDVGGKNYRSNQFLLPHSQGSQRGYAINRYFSSTLDILLNEGHYKACAGSFVLASLIRSIEDWGNHCFHYSCFVVISADDFVTSSTHAILLIFTA